MIVVEEFCLKLKKVGVVSKFGSKESEVAAKKVAKKLIAKKIEVFTLVPLSVPGAKKVETIEELKNTTPLPDSPRNSSARTWTGCPVHSPESPVLGINVG